MPRAWYDRHTSLSRRNFTRPINLAGTAAATSILRKFDTNTEAATANSQPCSSLRRQTCAVAGSKEAADGEFRQRPARRRARRHRGRRAPPAPRRRAAAAHRAPAGLAGVGRPRRGARVHRPRRRFALVTPVGGGRTGARGPARGGEHRDRVGQVLGLPASRPSCAGHRSARPGAVPVPDEGAGPRPVARRARADRGHPAAARSQFWGGSHRLRRRQPGGSPPVRARAVPMAVLQSRHDPFVDPAQPRPLGRAVAEPSFRDRRRMPLLPRCFRFQRGDGAAPVAAAVCAILIRAHGGLRQRDDGCAGGDGRRADRAAGRGGHRGRVTPRAPGRSRCGSRRCGPICSARTARRCAARPAPRRRG